MFDCYFFEKNLQGDIIAIYGEDGTKLCSYAYDAWGNATMSFESTTPSATRWFLTQKNPFRYRGYYYDYETGLYYLQSRYYNPTWGRFINADGVAYLGAGSFESYNLFAYCGNNPVMGYDPMGTWDWGLFAKVLITTTIVAACLTGVGAIAAAAATAASVPVAASVMLAVTTAAIPTALSAANGAICAEQSGGIGMMEQWQELLADRSAL